MVKTLHPLGPIAARIELPEDVRVLLVRDNGTSLQQERVALTDVGGAARAALESPLKFPPLAEGVVPGDQLAIAIDEAVPEAASVLRGVLAAAEAAKIDPTAIAIVSSDEDFCHRLRDEIDYRVRIVIHDPEDQENLALLGLNEKNERMLVNRTIFEADIVLPIGCARLESVVGSGVFEGLYPRLSDDETINRLQTPSQRSTPGRLAKLRGKADEAGWLLGVSMVMQVVPGPEGSIAAVVAGDPRAVNEQCQQLCNELWSFDAPQRVSLVIANVTGGPPEQTWDNIGRALAVADGLVEEYGGVVICSDLDQPPGQSVGELIGCSDFEALERDVRNAHSPDSWPAWQLARALQRGPVYFLSQLAAEDVEEMGLAPIESLEELERLARGQSSCIVIDDAQYTVATVTSEA